MRFDYTNLKKRIKASGMTIGEAGKVTGMANTIYRKLLGTVGFSQTDIAVLCDLLQIRPEEIGTLFFTREED
jgi:hypothetical protein